MIKKIILILILLCAQDVYTMDSACVCVSCPCASKQRCGDGQMTPLMLAVKRNDVKEVTLLLQKGENSSAYNLQEKRFVRDFNLIYDKNQLRILLIPVVDLMLKIETNNRISPHKPIDFQEALVELSQVMELRNALLIDKLLEDKEGLEYIGEHHSLLYFLKLPAVKRTMKKMFADNEDIKKNVPKGISAILTRFADSKH